MTKERVCDDHLHWCSDPSDPSRQTWLVEEPGDAGTTTAFKPSLIMFDLIMFMYVLCVLVFRILTLHWPAEGWGEWLLLEILSLFCIVVEVEVSMFLYLVIYWRIPSRSSSYTGRSSVIVSIEKQNRRSWATSRTLQRHGFIISNLVNSHQNSTIGMYLFAILRGKSKSKWLPGKSIVK